MLTVSTASGTLDRLSPENSSRVGEREVAQPLEHLLAQLAGRRGEAQQLAEPQALGGESDDRGVDRVDAVVGDALLPALVAGADGLQPLGVQRQDREDAAVDLARARVGAVVGAGVGIRARPATGRAVGSRVDVGLKRRLPAVDDRVQQLALGGEVVEQAALGDAGLVATASSVSFDGSRKSRRAAASRSLSRVSPAARRAI